MYLFTAVTMPVSTSLRKRKVHPPILRTARRTAVSLARLVPVAGIALLLSACTSGPSDVAVQVTGGDASRAPELIRQYGCSSCHTVPGVRSARGLVGPPLTDIQHRAYIAGVLPNTPENLIDWIRMPQAIRPGTAMPNMGVTDEDARHLAAYLYTR